MKVFKNGNQIHIDGEGQVFDYSGTLNIGADDNVYMTICNCVFYNTPFNPTTNSNHNVSEEIDSSIMEYSLTEYDFEEAVKREVEIRIQEILKDRSSIKDFILDPVSKRFDLLDLE